MDRPISLKSNDFKSDDGETEDSKDDVKDELDDLEFLSSNRTGRKTPAPRTVKAEPAEYVKIDLILPDGEEDMFEDVDEVDENGDEIVDLTYEGIAHVNGVRHFVCEGFKIRQIPEPFIVKRSLIDIFRKLAHHYQILADWEGCIESKSIVLDPGYQREVVWDEGRAALLITSILMGYFIPPIIFNVKKTMVSVGGSREERFLRTCVDGKQRLTSIWKFMKGSIGFFDTNAPQKKWHFCHPVIDGRIQISNRNVLPNAVKKFFETQFFCCYEYEHLTADTEETMFQLVQRGIALTPAERMRAMSTEWAMFTRQFEDDYALIVNRKSHPSSPPVSIQRRASGFRLILTVFSMIQEILARQKQRKRLSATPPLQASPQALLRILDSKAPIPTPLKVRLKAVFDRYEHLIKLSSTQITATRFQVNRNSVFDPAPKYLRAAQTNHVRTFSPLELVVTAILVATHMDHRSDEQLLEDVKELRTWLRRKHKDLRVNAPCWATAWGFITSEMDVRRGQKGSLSMSIEGASSASGAGPGESGGESPLSSAPSSPSPDMEMEMEMEMRQVRVKLEAKKRPPLRGKNKAAAKGNGSRKSKGAGSGSRATASKITKRSKTRRPPVEPVFANL
ncbi:hypothetical protein BUE80_DR000793 [Diplocarpon rosae]|nr:hypothetical protein BUE80_DR000793 [Diplocarpon rosae]